MRAFSRLLVVVMLFAWSFVALAAEVRDLKARFEGNQVHIEWSHPEEGEPDFYHVYYSRESILDNDGEYDDFEKVDGNKTTLILSEFPQSATLHIAVLPVNDGGNEAVRFTEEAVLALAEGSESTLRTPDDSAPSPTGTPAVAAPENVQNLEVKSQQQADGRYTVIAAWDAPASDVASYQVLHSIDNGITFSEPQAVGAGARFVRFTDVIPGQFTILVRTLNRVGELSTGAMASTTLEATTPQEVTPDTSVPADLTKTGAGLLGLLMVSGAAAGWRKAKRK